jgi:hypothetical protein
MQLIKITLELLDIDNESSRVLIQKLVPAEILSNELVFSDQMDVLCKKYKKTLIDFGKYDDTQN